MFYLKTKIGEGVEITAEITDENVYSRCIDCGREVQTPLDEEIVDGCLDLLAQVSAARIAAISTRSGIAARRGRKR